MWALFVLIKRQIVDDAAYCAAGLVASTMVIIAITSAVLTEEVTGLSFYTVTLSVGVPILIGIGSYALGLTQIYRDRTSGISALLSALPVARGQILAAHVVTGTLVILTVLVPLAITGAILWECLRPADWLFRGWLTDVLVGVYLTAFACYCVGLHAGQSAKTLSHALVGVPLATTLVLLIIVKGFGWPLVTILLLFTTASLLRCTSLCRYRPIRTSTIGVVTLVLLAVPLFGGRYLCDITLAAKMPSGISVSPSGLLPPEIENDPNVTDHSKAYVFVNEWQRRHTVLYRLTYPHSGLFYVLNPFRESHGVLESLGIIEYLESRKRGERHTYYNYDSGYRVVHLDEVRGQLICRHAGDQDLSDLRSWKLKRIVELYAGPQGVSSTRGNSVGRFVSPIVGRQHMLPLVVYDRGSRHFFAIDLENQTVRRSPQPQAHTYRPVAIGSSPMSDVFRLYFRPPSTKRGYLVPDFKSIRYLAVLDESGRIDLLDPNTLELTGPAGHLPQPRTLFGWGLRRPRDLLASGVDLIAIGLEPEYAGLIATSLSRQGTSMALATFDKEGKQVKVAERKPALYEVPWGPTLTITKYLLESLHPPALTLASFFTAYSFEAGSTHRAIFFMPNSFVALQQDRQANIVLRFLAALLFMVPALLLAGLLSWRVARRAEIIGLPPTARRLWLVGTLAFGLAGYITYRLTRPKETLVTCTNCGKLRRPDMDRCHRCGSRWHVPEITPPAWRVIDSV
jgi:hypothetical protein